MPARIQRGCQHAAKDPNTRVSAGQNIHNVRPERAVDRSRSALQHAVAVRDTYKAAPIGLLLHLLREQRPRSPVEVRPRRCWNRFVLPLWIGIRHGLTH
jgi:hypothetical protein